MQLAQPFLKFPFRFDVDRLRAEVAAIPEKFWREHQEGFAGNSALTLITTNGTDNDDVDPPMMPTEHLLNSPYILQVFAKFRTLHGRARLMRLAPQSGVPPHIDKRYYWRTRARVHIPVTTHPDIKFRCGSEVVHMAEGQAWTFDNWRSHQVINKTDTWRVHLTFDTFGGASFWNMARPHRDEGPVQFVPYQKDVKPVLTYETYVGDPVMPPGEVDFELSRLAFDVKAYSKNDPVAVAKFLTLLQALRREWRLLWHAKGPLEKTVSLFGALLHQMEQECVASIPESLRLASNGKPAIEILLADFAAMVKIPGAQDAAPAAKAQIPLPRFDRPVFIVAAPRSGSTLLFETLAANELLWTIGGEGHEHVEQIAPLNPENRDFHSNRLTAADANPDTVAQLHTAYAASLRMADGTTRYAGMGTARPTAVRLLEKTPKNALRIPFLRAAFPDAKFIFLHREAAPNISAIMEAWRSSRFVTYPALPGWDGPQWSLLLIPGWRELNGAAPAEVAMRQWRDTNETIMADLADLPADDWCSVRYEDILRDPAETLKRLCQFADIPFSDPMRAKASGPLRWSRYTLDAPAPDKWRKNEAAISEFLQGAQATIDKLSALRAAPQREAAQ